MKSPWLKMMTNARFAVPRSISVLERLKVRGTTQFSDPNPRFNTFTLINGAATFEANGEIVFAKRGESLLIPAGIEVKVVSQQPDQRGRG